MPCGPTVVEAAPAVPSAPATPAGPRIGPTLDHDDPDQTYPLPSANTTHKSPARLPVDGKAPMVATEPFKLTLVPGVPVAPTLPVKPIVPDGPRIGPTLRQTIPSHT